MQGSELEMYPYFEFDGFIVWILRKNLHRSETSSSPRQTKKDVLGTRELLHVFFVLQPTAKHTQQTWLIGYIEHPAFITQITERKRKTFLLFIDMNKSVSNR